MNNPKFIAIDGIDGCGKGTQIERLKEQFNDADIPAWFTAEPTSGRIGKMIRQDYLSGKVRSNHTVIDALYIADRVEHATAVNGIKYHLKSGEYVVSDRYIFSGITYTAANLFLDENNGIKSIADAAEAAIQYSKIVTDILMPDINIVLDVSPNTSIGRINKRGESKEIYENKRFLETVKDTYSIVKHGLQYFYPNTKFIKIDANGDPNSVSMQIWGELRYLL